MIMSLRELENWYAQECDGDWEHTYGIRIETLDNPGWMLTIDLEDTKWHDLTIARTIDERTSTDWVQHEAGARRYLALGGAHNLEEMIDKFLSIVRTREPRS